MRSLADQIERYIKRLLEQQEEGVVELRRNDLAKIFQCVPSQINYVLSTRFALEQGYLVESRRGGGGYIRIVKLQMEDDKELRKLIDKTSNNLISQQVGEGLIERLQEEGFLTRREAMLVKAIIRREALPLELPLRDMVRANILKAVLLTLTRDEFNQ
ncbi:MAG: CtsR family transcriptional regulator [Thermoanaerobacteraceae bacterium]|nr:CtsR family transcriptional regulator [Thermoanaerobacteraceae bacterium]